MYAEALDRYDALCQHRLVRLPETFRMERTRRQTTDTVAQGWPIRTAGYGSTL